MHRLRALLAASFLICFLTIVATAQDQALQLGTPIERQIAGRQSHIYLVTLEENQFAQLVVDQRGIDVVINVSSPEGKSLGDFDTPNGDNGPENVSFTGITKGIYRVTVTPLNQGEPGSGKYQIKLVELRQATEQEIARSKNFEVVKAKGIALLNDVDEMIPEIHTPQTRIRAQMKAGQLLWASDEKRAAKYYSDAMNGLKEMIATFATAEVVNQDYGRDYSAITQIRFELIQTLAQHDPDAALGFLYATKLPPQPYGNAREQLEQDHSLELSIANLIMGKDPKRALQIARQTLKNGYTPNLAFTVRNLQQAHPEEAAELASEIAAKLLGETLIKKQDAANLSVNMLNLCDLRPGQNQPGRESAPPRLLLPEATCRDLTQKMYREAMAFTLPSPDSYQPERYAAATLLNGLSSLGQNLDSIVDDGAAAVKKKSREFDSGSGPYQEALQQIQSNLNSGQPDSAVIESIQKMPDEMKEQAYIQLANALTSKGETARARQIINDNIANPYQKRQLLANLEQMEMQQTLASGKINEALRAVATLRTPRERANMLIQIVQMVAQGQGLKRAAALNSLEQARSLLAPGMQAQDQDQMNALLQLALAFARYDTKRAFEIVDPLAEQVNDLCAAARTLEGFGQEFYNDDELDLQNGSSVANAAVQVSTTLATLAMTNFERAKQTSDRLRLPEVRLRAYLEIAQQAIQANH